MSSIFNTPVATAILLGAIILFFIFQLAMLWRVRRILQQLSFYIESISRFFYRVGLAGQVNRAKKDEPHTCQFCKYRLSFIHMSDNSGEVEDFYYKCQLRKIEIKLDESCERFERDERY